MNYQCEQIGVLENKQVGESIYLLKVLCPKISNDVLPGQFIHLRLPRFSDHILRRPFSVYNADKKEKTLEILYQVVGFGTKHMTTLEKGEKLDVIGPVGNGWSVPDDAKRALIVFGGLGVASINMLLKELIKEEISIKCVYGALSEHKLVGIGNLIGPGVELKISTDDGSAGYHGLITDLLREELENTPPIPFDYIAVCGPKPMEEAVCDMLLSTRSQEDLFDGSLSDTQEYTRSAFSNDSECASFEHFISDQTIFEVSLENRMACGIGACLSCVVDTLDGKRRACVDGPVFDARKVVW